MTKNESFKRRIRERMASTGERYTAARRSLIDQVARRSREWVSDPEIGDEAIRANTGRGWDEWCDLIERWPGHTEGHTAIAAYLREEHGVDAWWSQSVTVGYERIAGIRLPHQRPDGTFTADKSRTVSIDADELRQLLLDDDDRADLFGGAPTDLRSKPTSKAIRVAMAEGLAVISLEPRSDGRTTITIGHEQLPEYSRVAEWKFYWSDWLTALEESDEGSS